MWFERKLHKSAIIGNEDCHFENKTLLGMKHEKEVSVSDRLSVALPLRKAGISRLR